MSVSPTYKKASTRSIALSEEAALALLRSADPDARKVRAWIKKHAQPGLAQLFPRQSKTGADWEAELWFLSQRFCYFWPVEGWEAASAKQRGAHVRRVKQLARVLAETLEADPHPYYPPVLALFETERALDTEDAPLFPALLRRLADYAEAQRTEPKRDHRPQSHNPDARAFARDLADYFSRGFHTIPDVVIAACVRLRFPDLHPSPDEKTVRLWRGK